MEHKIKLKFGYTDPKGVEHRDVTFGKRLTLGEMVLLDSNPQARSMTQREQIVRRMMVTKFGTLLCPVSLAVLNSLDTIDDDAMRSAADTFLQISREERTGEWLPDDECRLMFGIDIDGTNYDLVKFGNRLKVSDNVEAESLGLGDGIARVCYQICRQVSEIRNSESGIKIEGRLDREKLSEMDSEDFNILRLAAEFFRLGPAIEGKGVSEGDGGDGTADSTGNGVEGSGDTKSSD